MKENDAGARDEIAIVGWRPGLAKISLTKALRQIGQLTIPEAKHSVDALLEGEKVRLRVRPPSSIEDSIRRLEELGAVVAPRRETIS
jgi:ribosomal protein L7/L12